MTMENDIKEWIKNNFNFRNPDIIFNLEKCRTQRYHIQLKGVSGIYIITHIESKKRYIGSTKDFMKRISEHLIHLEKGDHHSIKLQNAVNKYGFSEFNIRIYPINKDRNFLYDVEEILIKVLNTFKEGYNMSEKSRTPELSEEQRLKHSKFMSNKWKGVPKTEEQKRKIGITKSIQNSGEGNPNSKLDKQKVLFIREHVLEYTGKEFQEMFNIAKGTLGSIVHLRSWNYPECIPENYIPPKSLRKS